MKTHCAHGHPRTPDNVSKWNHCKICHREQTARWKKAHPEYTRAQGRAARARQPDRTVYYQIVYWKRRGRFVLNPRPKTLYNVIAGPVVAVEPVGLMNAGPDSSRG